MNFLEGEILLVDKEYTWTSFDAVNKLRWHLKKKLGIKNIKVGHAGTLDPLATGLLIVCTGKKTKTIDSLMLGEKTYTGTFLLGKTTPSFDLETEFDQDYLLEHIKKEDLIKAAEAFLGKQEQIPPMYSAKKIDGKRAYDFARKGLEIELKTNFVEITKFKIDINRFPEIDFEICCSKGTYIRSIARDFGERLNSGATLIALRRTRSGEHHVDHALKVDQWITQIENL